MGHRTEQVPQREVLIKTPPKGAGFQLAPAVCSLVDVMKRVNYLGPEKPLATKGQAQKRYDLFNCADISVNGITFCNFNRRDYRKLTGNQSIAQYLSVHKDSFSNPSTNRRLEEAGVGDWPKMMKFKAL
ncbi:hypothetical protein AVEN_143321-1 [Araneus ventricosus]|uniref:Uncharacterized protein n=1 Tax=Araneus ventricosus TaxID=182803 RepID=A0A4Y2ADR5_ARAVE|nr:hypothetical protein AVEN_143321-1 [Araneus ventricosus]